MEHSHYSSGEIARYYSDAYLQFEDICIKKEAVHTNSIWDDYNCKRLFWVSKHGDSIRIQELGHMHLLNIRNLLKRRMEQRPWKLVIPEFMDILEHEIKKRGLPILDPVFFDN